MRQVAVLGGLLAVSLVGSYLTWTAPETAQSEDDTVAMYQAATDDLQAVAWLTEDLKVRIERKSDASGPYTWVTVTEIVESTFTPEPADTEEPEDTEEVDVDAPEGPEGPDAEGAEEVEAAPETEDAPEPVVTREEKTVSFLGNDTAEDIWQTFAPLYALRKLDGQASKAAFGLEEPDGTLEVTRRSGPLELLIGGESYGTKDQYLGFKDAVYLVDSQKIRPLKYGKTRLVQRLVMPVAKKDARSVTVTAPGGTATFVQQNADDLAKAFWAPEADAQTAHDEATSWMEKLFRLRVQSYAGDTDVSGMTEAFSATIKDAEAAWTVQVLEGPEDKWYAVSSFNRVPVELTKTLAEEAAADVGLLFEASAEEPAEE